MVDHIRECCVLNQSNHLNDSVRDQVNVLRPDVDSCLRSFAPVLNKFHVLCNALGEVIVSDRVHVKGERGNDLSNRPYFLHIVQSKRHRGIRSACHKTSDTGQQQLDLILTEIHCDDQLQGRRHSAKTNHNMLGPDIEVFSSD